MVTKYIIDQGIKDEPLDKIAQVFDINSEQLIILDKDQIKKASKLMAKSFEQYPLFMKTIPNKQKRLKKLALLHEIILNYTLAKGYVLVAIENQKISGILLSVMQKGSAISNYQMVLSGALKIPLSLGSSFLKENKKYESKMNEIHDQLCPFKHNYLWVLAVDPHEQGKGIGKKLLAKMIDNSDHAGLPIYLETNDPKNVGIYQKMGFDLKKEIEIEGIKLFAMVRMPGSEIRRNIADSEKKKNYYKEKLKNNLSTTAIEGVFRGLFRDGMNVESDPILLNIENKEEFFNALNTILFDYIGYANEDSAEKWRPQMYRDVSIILKTLEKNNLNQLDNADLKREMVL